MIAHVDQKSLRARAIVMLTLATFLWGLSFPAIKTMVLVHRELLPASGDWFVTAMALAPRFAIGVVVLLMMSVWSARRGRAGGRQDGDGGDVPGAMAPTRLEWKQGLVLGLFSAAGMLFQSDGLQYTAASTSAFLTQLYAILIPVSLALWNRRNPGLRVWLCCALVTAGVAILGQFNWREMSFGRGEWETLVASAFFMGQILSLEKNEYAGNRAEKITLVMFIVQAAAFGAFAWATAPTTGAATGGAALLALWSSPVWVAFTLGLALFSTVGAYTLMNAWQPKISATEAGLIYCMEPVFGSLMALVLPGLFSAWAGVDYANEVTTWTLMIGGGLITGANVVLQLKRAEGAKV